MRKFMGRIINGTVPVWQLFADLSSYDPGELRAYYAYAQHAANAIHNTLRYHPQLRVFPPGSQATEHKRFMLFRSLPPGQPTGLNFGKIEGESKVWEYSK